LLARHDAEIRANPPAAAGCVSDRPAGVVRELGTRNTIIFSTLSEEDADRIIAREAAYFRELGESVEWKVYGHDLPADLPLRLAAHGFEADESETLMALDLSPVRQRIDDSGFAVRRITSERGLHDLVAVDRAAFEEPRSDIFEYLAPRVLGPQPDTLAFVAYARDVPVCAGRIILPPERAFASMWGGCTIPGYRGRGAFRAIVAARANEARLRGYAYLMVEARETSRPILARLGFVPLTRVTGWVLPATQAVNVQGSP
jgi:GNAT superfamily N-acetyltransferase